MVLGDPRRTDFSLRLLRSGQRHELPEPSRTPFREASNLPPLGFIPPSWSLYPGTSFSPREVLMHFSFSHRTIMSGTCSQSSEDWPAYLPEAQSACVHNAHSRCWLASHLHMVCICFLTSHNTQGPSSNLQLRTSWYLWSLPTGTRHLNAMAFYFLSLEKVFSSTLAQIKTSQKRHSDVRDHHAENPLMTRVCKYGS